MNLTDITKQIRAFADQLEEQSKIGLAMPPDGRPLRNEDELTAEQVGAGFRLTIKEDVFSDASEVWNSARKEWRKTSTKSFDPVYTYRLPLSVPWPLQTKNPSTPPFQLPPPPPGMQWHRLDGWKAEDLTPGKRPLVENEILQTGDEVKNGILDGDRFILALGSVGRAAGLSFEGQLCRTTRPLIFQHAGKSWTYHRPGNPMPCDGGRNVEALCHYQFNSLTTPIGKAAAAVLCWSENSAIIGWRYAEPLTREVELGPEDVRCGDELLMAGKRYGILTVTDRSVEYLAALGFHQVTFAWLLANGVTIRRNGSEVWEKCSKEVPA